MLTDLLTRASATRRDRAARAGQGDGEAPAQAHHGGLVASGKRDRERYGPSGRPAASPRTLATIGRNRGEVLRLQAWRTVGMFAAAAPHLASVVVYTSTVNSSLRTSLYCLVTPGATRIPGGASLPPATNPAGPPSTRLLSH